jgi:hypothetical protein
MGVGARRRGSKKQAAAAKLPAASCCLLLAGSNENAENINIIFYRAGGRATLSARGRQLQLSPLARVLAFSE